MARSVCVITGAAGALGAELASVLLGAGYALALVDRDQARARLDELARTSPNALAAAMDATDPSAWAGALDRIEKQLGPVTHAVLVAGTWAGGAPFHAADPNTYTSLLQTNLETARQALAALLPGLVARGAGSVVVIGSRVVERPWESAGAAAYAASKAAVVALAQSIAAELLPHGVRVNAVLPSIIDTPANRRAMPDADFTRWVRPSSLSAVIRFLLSDDARDVSGAALPVYGRA